MKAKNQKTDIHEPYFNRLRNSSVALVFFFTTILVQVSAQKIIFNKVIPSDGNSFTFVNGITQDIDGFMWFATKRGIYTYDGTHMTTYKKSSLNSNSLAGNLAESIFADNDGTIWIGSLGNGLNHFDHETRLFTLFRHDPDNPGSLSNDTVTSILRDSDGILWIATHQGLDQFNPETKEFIHFRHRDDDSTSLSSNQVRIIYEDKQGTLWIGTGSPYASDGGGIHVGGLNRMDKSTGHFTRYRNDQDDPESLLSNKVSAIFEDDQGTLWVGSLGGLHKMNREEGTFERLIYDPAFPESFSGPFIEQANSDWEHITFIHQDAAGSYWYGTVQSGLYYFNSGTGKMIRYHTDGDAPGEFSDNGAWQAYTTRDGILWIGTAQGNLYRINPFQTEIPYINIPGSSVNAFFEEPDGTFWIGTGQGLIHQDKMTGNSKSILIDTNRGTQVNNINCIYSDHSGNIWIGSSGGLAKLNKENEKFIVYKNEPGNNNSLSSNYVITIFEDKDLNFWIATTSGLNLLNKQKENFQSFNTSLIVTAVFEDSSGNLFVGAWNGRGIFLFNRETREVRLFQPGVSVVCIFEDHENVLWLGTIEGLFKYDKEAQQFMVVSGLNSIAEMSEIASIQEDSQSNLWIACAEGVIKINPERNSSRIFGKEYGVGRNAFIDLASYKDHNGELYFGAANGYFAFDPADFNDNPKPPEVAITNFYLANNIVKPGNGSPLKENLSQTKSITLRFYQKNFSFDFAVIDYSNPESNHLLYMMENFEKEWRLSSSDRRAYYFNLPSGKYTFRVKGANSSGIWTEKNIDIIILPPWWRTWWAYISYALVLIAGIFGIDRYQRHRLLNAEREKNREREILQAKEIENAYTELKTTQAQLIQSEKMASLGELTAGIAHEIQNPLNFVNNFSEINSELIQEMMGEIEKGNLEEVKVLAGDIAENENKINHHGKRADAIVKGMLQHSRSSNGQKEPTDINALADEYLRLSYHGLRAKDKSFNADFNTDFDTNLPKINVISQDIGRVLLNLINNAFYAVNERRTAKITHALSPQTPQYKPTVTVSTKNRGDRIEISVKDNGHGIPDEIRDKILQPFFTTKKGTEGTGLGLSITNDIVKAHGGSLTIESDSSGSTFTFYLQENQ
jgi:ligand-binding sensor domain-containing protein/signal transduction histidine kinase